NNGRDQQQYLAHPGSQHPAIREEPGSCLPCKSLRRFRQRRANRGNELLPGRRPFHEKFGRVVHNVLPFRPPEVISNSSPIAVPVVVNVSKGSSRTETAFLRTGAIRQGRKLFSKWTTFFVRSR